MLFNPKWKQWKPKEVFSFVNIINWLETKPPNEEYDFNNTKGYCFFSQYLTEVHQRPRRLSSSKTFADWDNLHCSIFRSIAEWRPWTFGAALERAKRKCYETHESK